MKQVTIKITKNKTNDYDYVNQDGAEVHLTEVQLLMLLGGQLAVTFVNIQDGKTMYIDCRKIE